MARPGVEDKDVITIDEAIDHWHLSRYTVRKFFKDLQSADYLAFYRGRKLILKAEFEKFLWENPEMKEVLTHGKSWKRNNQA